MHRHFPHGHLARRYGHSEGAALENSDSLANIVERADENGGDAAVVYSIVYTTAPATFTGPTAGFITLGYSSTKSSASAKSTNRSADQDTTSPSSASAESTTTAKSTLTKSAAELTSTGSSQSTTAARSQSSSASASSLSSSAASSTTAAPSSTPNSEAALNAPTTSISPSASPAASPGLSSGAKGGIAVGVILGLALVAGLVFFFYRRKRAQQGDQGGAQRLAEDENEKMAPPPASNASAPAPAPAPAPDTVPRETRSLAPRLSIRPTSQFSPGVDLEQAAAVVGAAAAVGGGEDDKSAPERPNPATDPANPFGIHAETVNAPSTERAASPLPKLDTSPTTALFDFAVPTTSDEAARPRSASPTNSQFGTPLGSPIGSPIDFPMTPSKTEFGIAAAIPVFAGSGAAAFAASDSAAAAPPPPPVNNVHRVQLEFKPSMDDELELKMGSLARVLHEYDDGWALCMTMDRSKQGVAPRSCLSKHPLKPRPASPVQARPTGPPSPKQALRLSSRPSSLIPAPLSPSMNGRISPALSERQRTPSGLVTQPPTGQMSPGPKASSPMAENIRRRSSSVGAMTTQDPNNPSPAPARKPVPGLAL